MSMTVMQYGCVAMKWEQWYTVLDSTEPGYYSSIFIGNFFPADSYKWNLVLFYVGAHTEPVESYQVEYASLAQDDTRGQDEMIWNMDLLLVLHWLYQVIPWS